MLRPCLCSAAPIFEAGKILHCVQNDRVSCQENAPDSTVPFLEVYHKINIWYSRKDSPFPHGIQ